VFERAPGGYFDSTIGRRLRDEVYAVGDSRDANVTIEKFLGRSRSIEPFLKKIGVTTSAEPKSSSPSKAVRRDRERGTERLQPTGPPIRPLSQ